MWERVIEWPALGFYAVAAPVAFFVGALAGTIRKEGGGTVLSRALEAAVLAPLGGFLARLFISVLLGAAGDSRGACLTVGWSFFLWPGAIDTLPALLGDKPVFTPPVLLWTAAAVGSFVGMMDGLWRIHPWTGWGPLAFLLDVTWGLAGNTNACLVHLINFVWGDHADHPRSGAHRYHKGCFVKRGYAFTQGSVMSNLGPSSGNLVDHELLHVAQNRLFGPLFILTYVGWMAVMLIPGLIAGALRGAPFAGAERWCYVNNPWEAWAFAKGGWRDPAVVWGKPLFRTVTVLYFLAALAAAVLVVWQVWLNG